jgi:DNA-directed RNA polymerase subunit RPC12/RpoP
MKKGWLCEACGKRVGDEQLLRAPNPFEAAHTMYACPYCRTMRLYRACDTPGCKEEATSACMVDGIYRFFCEGHKMRMRR